MESWSLSSRTAENSGFELYVLFDSLPPASGFANATLPSCCISPRARRAAWLLLKDLSVHVFWGRRFLRISLKPRVLHTPPSLPCAHKVDKMSENMERSRGKDVRVANIVAAKCPFPVANSFHHVKMFSNTLILSRSSACRDQGKFWLVRDGSFFVTTSPLI